MPGWWVVESDDAYAIWAVRKRPSAEEKCFVVNWLAEREANGPPDDATVDDKQNWTARAGGFEFYFCRFDLPGHDPAGLTAVMKSGDCLQVEYPTCAGDVVGVAEEVAG